MLTNVDECCGCGWPFERRLLRNRSSERLMCAAETLLTLHSQAGAVVEAGGAAWAAWAAWAAAAALAAAAWEVARVAALAAAAALVAGGAAAGVGTVVMADPVGGA
eukprot:2722634-Pleurochrysis_carterae.AAC.3